MNGRLAKKLRREARKLEVNIAQAFVSYIHRLNFWLRLKLCWRIFFKTLKKHSLQ